MPRLTKSKFYKRALVIVTNSLNSLLLPLLNIIVSFLVIRLASTNLWGEVVSITIVVQLGVHVIAWGNKEYLLREFSLNPAQISQVWQTCLFTRLPLWIVFCGIMLLSGEPLYRVLWITVWSLGLVLYQAHQVFILYKKAFGFPIVVELCSLAFLAATIAGLKESLSLDILVALFGIVNLGKAAALLARFYPYTLGRDNRSRLRGTFDARYFASALSFFLLGFSGMLQSRIDLYCVNYFLPHHQVGQYQVFINLMIYLQSIAAFILMPFVKSIYRLGYDTISKLSVRLFIVGLLMLPPALVLVHLTLTLLYRFKLSAYFLLFGGLYVLPIYFYLPIIYALYKAHRQSVVLTINGLGLTLTFTLNLILLPRVGMIGAIISVAIVKWIVLTFYLSQGKKLRIKNSSYALSKISWKTPV